MGFLLLAPPCEAEDLVARFEAFGVGTDRDDGAGYAVAEDLGRGDEEVAVGLVEVQGGGGCPFDVDEGFVEGGDRGFDLEDL